MSMPNETRIKIEKRIVRALLRHLKTNGFVPVGVWIGDEYVAGDGKSEITANEVINGVFAVDDSSLRVRGNGGKTHGILLVGGNGEDILSDWNYTEGDPDGFNAVMDAFDPYNHI